VWRILGDAAQRCWGGNLTGDGTFTYEYNAAGRLVRAESVTATLVYTYNAAGLRVAQSVDGDVTAFTWDWATGLPEMLSAGDALYLIGHETLGQWDGDAWGYYLPDALGSMRQVANGAGTVVDAREWTPYGVEIRSAQAGLGYTGEWQDASLEMVYLRARWLDAQVGRFTRRDEWSGNHQQPLTMNPYLYALVNPILFGDPSGRDPIRNAQDLIGRLAVLWYREHYSSAMDFSSRVFSIDIVELEAGLYTMGSGEGFVSDALHKYTGFKQDELWWYLAFELRFWARGCMDVTLESQPWNNPLSRFLEKWGKAAEIPSLGVAQIDPPDAIAVEEYWAGQGVPDVLSPPDWISSREEWLTNPIVGINYLAAYVGWSRRELEEFTSETGVRYKQENEWWFIGKMVNGGNPSESVYELITAFHDEGFSGASSYWNQKIAPDNKLKTASRYVKYMTSPLPQHLKLSNLHLYLNPQ